MKRIVLSLLVLLNLNSIAQEKKDIIVKTEAKAVTVFMKSAQITRKKVVELPAGKSTVKFTELSPYIDEKSIQVKVGDNVVVLSVGKQLNFIDSASKWKNLGELRTKLRALQDKISLETTKKEIIEEEYTFLKDNRILGGKNQEVKLANLKQAADY